MREGVGVYDGVLEPVGVNDAVCDDDGVEDGVMLPVRVLDWVRDDDDVAVALAVALPELLGVAPTDSEALDVVVLDGLLVWVGVGVCDAV